MIDVHHQISAVERTVGDRVLEAGTARVLTTRQSYDARRTRFTLEHVAHVDDDRWLQYGPGAVGVGWDLALTALGFTWPQAWRTTRRERRLDGLVRRVEFVTRSSRGWADASIATGTDATEARAAEERTTAFYTGTGG
jgi:hypothetical protein